MYMTSFLGNIFYLYTFLATSSQPCIYEWLSIVSAMEADHNQQSTVTDLNSIRLLFSQENNFKF